MQPFTAIVGPNGSGKSNLIDALLFVFGFKARKMRQGRLADLIHVSDQHPSLDWCEVTVEFCLEADKMLCVSRRVHRNNRSEYFVDGGVASHAHVTELLRQFGLDLDHNRFLILQGEVELISLMKPKGTNEHEEGLLEYLEDIVGTNTYIAQIEASKQQHEQLAPQETEAFAKFQLAKREWELVDEQRAKIQSLVDAYNDEVSVRGKLLQVEKHENGLLIEKNQKSIEALTSKLESETSAVREELSTHDTMDIDAASLQQNIRSLEEKHRQVKQDLSSKCKQTIALEEDIRFAKQQAKKMQQTVDGDEQRAAKSRSKIAELQHEIAAKQQEMADIERELQNSSDELSRLEAGISSSAGAAKQEVESVQAALLPIKNTISDLQRQLSKNQQEYEQFCEERDTNLKTIDAENGRMLDFSETLKQKQQEVDELQTRSSAINERIHGMQPKIDSAKQELQHLTERLSGLREESVQDGVLSHGVVRMLQEELSIDGIHGRLGDLGCIEDKYCHAANCASDSTMENIVVDSTLVAQRCVDVLKSRNAGVCTFIILDQIKRMTEQRTSFPACRLVDLVECNSMYRDAFYHALGDTLVCDSMDEANRIAFGQKQRHRVVTLDGKLIDLSGAISGGGEFTAGGSHFQRGIRPKSSSTGNPKQRSSMEDISALKQQIAELEGAVAAKNSQLRGLQNSLEEFQCLEQEISAALKANDAEIHHLKRSILFTEKHLHTAKEKESELAGQQDYFKDVNQKIGELQQTLSGLQQSASQHQANIAELEERIMQAGGAAYRAASSKVATLKDRKELLSGQVAKARMEVAVIERRSEGTVSDSSSLERIQQLQQEAETGSKLLADLKKEIEVATAHEKELLEQIQLAKQELTQQKETRSKIDSLKRHLAALETTFQAENESILATISKLNAKVAQAQAEIDSLSFIRFQDSADTEQLTIPELSPTELDALVKHKSQLAAQLHSLQQSGTRISQTQVDKFSLELDSKTQACNAALSLHTQVRSQREECRRQAELLQRKRHNEFMQGLHEISSHLKHMYQTITQGGNAELELVDSLDPFSEGVVFSVMPPKKSWKSIAHLSGGEKTLSSLALVFALHMYRPTPFYVMDEIDAALDYRNVAIIASYIRQRTSRDAQFLVISLRNGMFELADDLIGVYKRDNCSLCVKCLV